MVLQKIGAGALIAAGLAFAAGACGSAGKSLCDRSCDCTGCSDGLREDCYDATEDAELDAEQADCLPEYNELIACYSDSFECVNDQVQVDECAGELLNLLECADGL